MDNTKISKSLGNLVDPLTMRDKYGFAAFRYYMLREMSWGVDTDFSETGLVTRVNADLANDLGNLLNRSIGMLGKYFDGIIPEGRGTERAGGEPRSASPPRSMHNCAPSARNARSQRYGNWSRPATSTWTPRHPGRSPRIPRPARNPGDESCTSCSSASG